MRILLVDDTHDTLQLYCLVLELHGFNVQLARNGEDAVRSVQQSRAAFDAIIMDVEMPGMNGWDALQAIREMPQGQKSHIVMFTAYGQGEDLKAQAQKLGADSLMLKPVLPQELIDSIRNGVTKKQMEQRRNA
jgi:CheY-like chemotaxis protein